jgi:hypothetical protein
MGSSGGFILETALLAADPGDIESLVGPIQLTEVGTGVLLNQRGSEILRQRPGQGRFPTGLGSGDHNFTDVVRSHTSQKSLFCQILKNPSMENPKLCKNCSSELSGPFCAQCGQKYINQRMTVRNFISYFLHSITNIDRGLWYTLGQLFRSPGKVILEYINGRTRPYYHPLRLAFLMGTISVVVFLAFNSYEATQDAYQDMISPNADEKARAMQAKVQEAIKPFMNLFPILLIPFYALISYRLYRKRELNLAEHMVLHAYNYGIITVISLPLLVLYAFWIPITYGPLFGWTFNALALAFIFRQIFKDSLFTGFIKGLLSVLFGYLLFFIIFIIIGILIVIPYMIITGR